jgi:hypothetical protein
MRVVMHVVMIMLVCERWGFRQGSKMSSGTQMEPAHEASNSIVRLTRSLASAEVGSAGKGPQHSSSPFKVCGPMVPVLAARMALTRAFAFDDSWQWRCS